MQLSGSFLRARVVASLAVLGMSSVARAQSSDDHARAVAAFQEARALIQAGHCDQAIPKLQASLTFEASVGTNLSLAECYERVDPLAAWKPLKEAQRLSYLKHDDRMAVAESRAAALEPKLAIVHVALSPATVDLPGLEVRIDGNVVDRFYYGDGGSIAVYPGRHRLAVTAPGKVPWTESFEGTVGKPVSVGVQLEDGSPAVTSGGHPSSPPPPPVVLLPAPSPPVLLAPVSPPPAHPDAHDGSARRTTGLVVGGVGVAGLVAGVITGSLVFVEKGSITSSCTIYPQCGKNFSSAESSYGKAQTLGAASEVGFIAGGAALVTGAVIYFTAPRSSSPTAALRIAPLGWGGGGGVELTRAW
jgi:hypothetical protein